MGRLLSHNLFRESDDAVKEALRSYLINNGCAKSSQLVSDSQIWCSLGVLLRDEVEVADNMPTTSDRRIVSAIRAVMADPDVTDSQLARIVNTTPRQIARMSHVNVIRKLWRLRSD